MCADGCVCEGVCVCVSAYMCAYGCACVCVCVCRGVDGVDLVISVSVCYARLGLCVLGVGGLVFRNAVRWSVSTWV